MKGLREVLQYIMSLAGASTFYVLIIASIALMTMDDFSQMKWAVWFVGILLLFYGFIASLLWELVFQFAHFKTLWRGGVLYLLLGAICGGVATAVVHFNVAETDVMGWIGGMTIMGIAAFIFYAIRRIPHQYR